MRLSSAAFRLARALDSGFLGQDSDVRLDAHDPAEFCDWKWIEPQLLPSLIVPFKKAVYDSVVAEFTPLIG